MTLKTRWRTRRTEVLCDEYFLPAYLVEVWECSEDAEKGGVAGCYLTNQLKDFSLELSGSC
jgi:hypothetical protein